MSLGPASLGTVPRGRTCLRAGWLVPEQLSEHPSPGASPLTPAVRDRQAMRHYRVWCRAGRLHLSEAASYPSLAELLGHHKGRSLSHGLPRTVPCRKVELPAALPLAPHRAPAPPRHIGWVWVPGCSLARGASGRPGCRDSRCPDAAVLQMRAWEQVAWAGTGLPQGLCSRLRQGRVCYAPAWSCVPLARRSVCGGHHSINNAAQRLVPAGTVKASAGHGREQPGWGGLWKARPRAGPWDLSKRFPASEERAEAACRGVRVGEFLKGGLGVPHPACLWSPSPSPRRTGQTGRDRTRSSGSAGSWALGTSGASSKGFGRTGSKWPLR